MVDRIIDHSVIRQKILLAGPDKKTRIRFARAVFTGQVNWTGVLQVGIKTFPGHPVRQDFYLKVDSIPFISRSSRSIGCCEFLYFLDEWRLKTIRNKCR